MKKMIIVLLASMIMILSGFLIYTVTKQQAEKLIYGNTSDWAKGELAGAIYSSDSTYLRGDGNLIVNDKNDVSTWAVSGVDYVYENDIMKGEGNTFNAKGTASIEQAVAIANRVYNKYASDFLNDDSPNEEAQKENSKTQPKGVVIDKQYLHPIDFDLLYFMDGDINFLTMKGMGLPSEDEAYYVNTYYPGFDVRFYVADDKYNINRITLIRNFDEELSMEYERESFRGLYIGMPMELANDYLQNESKELVVEYSDYHGDDVVYQIDVYSKKETEKRINSEDFYFKFFGLDIEKEYIHIGNNNGGQETLETDNKKRTYTYNIVFGSDEYQKVYTYDGNNSITSMEIKCDDDEFLAVVPSLLGIRLGSNKAEISKMVKAANKTIHSSKPSSIMDSQYNVEEYTIIENASKIAYTAEVYIDKSTNIVRKVKGYFSSKTKINYDNLLDLLGKKLNGRIANLEGIGVEQWVVNYVIDDEDIIRSITLFPTQESVFINQVPTLLGLELNMFEMSVYHTLSINGYEHVGSVNDGETLGYIVVDPKTKKQYKVVVESQHIGEISASIVESISVSYFTP